MLVAAVIAGRRLPQLLQSNQPGLQGLRSILLMATTFLFNAGIVYVPLPMGTTIMFLSPIILTMLSSVLLKEHVGWRRWSSIAVGFVGALVTIRVWETGLNGVNHGAALLLVSALCNAAYLRTRAGRVAGL